MEPDQTYDTDAWLDLADSERERAWDHVHGALQFRPSMKPECWPGFLEPEGSITWSLRSLYDGRTELHTPAEVSVSLALGQALAELQREDEYVIALDWQHPAYEFHPRALSKASGSWRIPVLPDGDYYLFLAQDFRFGWLGHPWEQTVCCYGELIPAMSSCMAGLGLQIVRGETDDRLT